MEYSRYRKDLGVRGEELAAQWFIAQGYRLIARNWRCKESKGEIDLIVEQKNCLVFVEIKTRFVHHPVAACEDIRKQQQQQIGKMAHWFLVQNEDLKSEEFRFDSLGITWFSSQQYHVNHLPNAFDPAMFW